MTKLLSYAVRRSPVKSRQKIIHLLKKEKPKRVAIISKSFHSLTGILNDLRVEGVSFGLNFSSTCAQYP